VFLSTFEVKINKVKLKSPLKIFTHDIYDKQQEIGYMNSFYGNQATPEGK